MKQPLSVVISSFLILISGCKTEPIQLEWNQEDGYRWVQLITNDDGRTGFEKLYSSRTGISFSNFVSADDIAENHHLVNGSGVAAGDINGNGWVDLYFTRLNGPNKLYMNLGGMQFRDVTEAAGVKHENNYSRGAVFADVNGNGHLDLLVTSVSNENVLYLNDGQGNFTRSENSGLGPAKGSTTMALADVTGNGYLDLYVVNFKEKAAVDIFDPFSLNINNTVRRVDDAFEMIPPFDEHYALFVFEEYGPARFELGEKDELYLNNGDGTFERVENLERIFLSETGEPKGLFPDWGLDAKFHDINNNGLPDLYVANDVWTPDRVWINQGDGTFRAQSQDAIRRYSYSSMGVDFSDINRNGLTDIFVVEMLDQSHKKRLSSSSINFADVTFFTSDLSQRPEGDAEKFYRHNRNSLYINRGDDTYAETAYYSNLEASGWSWATKFMDVNLNGFEDILITNGFNFNVLDLDDSAPPGSQVDQDVPRFMEQQNKIFRNNGDLTFDNVSSDWGITEEDISHGMAFADLNNDGYLDIVINRLNEEALILKNTSSSPRIAIRLNGSKPNTQAIGAKVKLTGGPVSNQTKEISAGGDYLSGSDPLTVFAADKSNLNHKLIITWPDGMQSMIDSVQPNRIYEIAENEVLKVDRNNQYETNIEPYFSDKSHLLNHTHHEDPFDDYDIQPLLPQKLSRLGPGMAWIDLNQNSHDDLIIGTGKGGSISLFENDGDGNFSLNTDNEFNGREPGDITSIVSWNEKDRTNIVVGLSHYERGISRGTSAYVYQYKDGNVIKTDSLSGSVAPTGSITAADYSGNGYVDLFVGGRFIPGQYPKDASSKLYLNDGDKLVLDEQNTKLLEDLGLVTSALFVDYNLNGQQDLIVATEWGSIYLFENRNGKLTDRSDELNLSGHLGWWQGLAAGDFTGNGYPDLVVTNMGENTPYKRATKERPLKLYFDDMNRDGHVDIIDAYYDEELGGYVPRRQLAKFLYLRNELINTETNRRFANSTINDLVSQGADQLSSKEINTLKHTVFLNQEGNGFIAKPLPVKAQLAPGFYVGVADMDNNGIEDIFLTQNFFTVADINIRPDAGRGLWLRGDGKGNFEAVPGHESGVMVYGDQRGAALGDFDGDGKVDLAVTQNAAETKLFRNNTDKRGIRIQLQGPPKNISGIGSRMSLIYDDNKKGPARTVQAGSGYLSQNSSTQILGYSKVPSYIEVTWMSGIEQRIKFEPGKLNYVITYPK